MGQVIDSKVTKAQILETDECGRLLLPADLLGDAQPYSRYKVQVSGKKLVVEAEAISEQPQKTNEEWEQQWRELSEEIGKVWPAGVSAVDVVSEMRR